MSFASTPNSLLSLSSASCLFKAEKHLGRICHPGRSKSQRTLAPSRVFCTPLGVSSHRGVSRPDRPAAPHLAAPLPGTVQRQLTLHNPEPKRRSSSASWIFSLRSLLQGPAGEQTGNVEIILDTPPPHPRSYPSANYVNITPNSTGSIHFAPSQCCLLSFGPTSPPLGAPDHTDSVPSEFQVF